MKEVSIGVYHHGCWGSGSAEKFPNSKGTLVGPITLLPTKKAMRVVSTFNHHFTDKKEIDDYLKYSKVHPSMKHIDVLHRTNTRLFATFTWEGSSSYDSVMHKGVAYTAPITQEKGGLEVHQVLTKNPRNLKNLLKELEILGEVKILKIKKPSEIDNPYNLTEKQAQALRIARSMDYYTWPRNVTLEELASYAGTTRRAYQENLRKAEAKVFPNFLNKELAM